MPRGSYLHLDPHDGTPAAVEDFACAAGPSGWRYTSVLRDAATGAELGRVDVTLDTGGRQVRVELLAGGWRLRAGVAGRETLWLRTPADGPLDPVVSNGAGPPLDPGVPPDAEDVGEVGGRPPAAGVPRYADAEGVGEVGGGPSGGGSAGGVGGGAPSGSGETVAGGERVGGVPSGSGGPVASAGGTGGLASGPGAITPATEGAGGPVAGAGGGSGRTAGPAGGGGLDGVGELSSVAAGLTGRSPAFLIATARRLRLSPGGRARVRLVLITEPALGALEVDETWSLVGITTHATETGPLPVARYDVADLSTGTTRAIHIAGDVVVAAPALELTALHSPPTLDPPAS